MYKKFEAKFDLSYSFQAEDNEEAFEIARDLLKTELEPETAERCSMVELKEINETETIKGMERLPLIIKKQRKT